MLQSPPLTEKQKAVLSHRGHLSLTANAGSGKTFILSKVFVEQALRFMEQNDNFDIRSLAAITFTDKAAGELYTRIIKQAQEELKRAVDSHGDKDLQRRLRRLRDQLIAANIQTIHTFCIDLLRSYPLQGEIDAKFTVINQLEKKEMLEGVISDAISEMLLDKQSEDAQYLTQIILQIGSEKTLRKHLSEVLGKAQVLDDFIPRQGASAKIIGDSPEIPYIPFDYEDVKGTASFLKNKRDQLLQVYFGSFIDSAVQAVLNLDGIAQKYEEEHGIALHSKAAKFNKAEGSFLDKILLILSAWDNIFASTLATDNPSIRKKGFIPKQGMEEANAAAKPLYDNISLLKDFFSEEEIEDDNKLTDRLALLARTMMRLYSQCYTLYSHRKEEGAYVDFDDILVKVKHLLSNPQNEDVREELSRKYKFIVIDEFQDTNELQYSIFRTILNNLENAGTLVVVGDEKQSIYRFQNAELEVFLKTKKDITGKDGCELRLSESFRMAPELCFLINTIFEKQFTEEITNTPVKRVDKTETAAILPEHQKNIIFEPTIAVEKKDGAIGFFPPYSGAAEILIYKKPYSKNDGASDIFLPCEPEINIHSEQPSENEYELIARRILKLRQDTAQRNENIPIPWKDIAVLAGRNKYFPKLEPYLKKYGIPYTIAGGRGFYSQQIIGDLFLYVSFLADQHNDEALVGILRSPFFSVSDREIFNFSRGEEKLSLWEKMCKFQNPGTELQRAHRLLEKHCAYSASRSVTETLNEIISDTGIEAYYASRSTGAQAIANIEKLYTLADDFSGSGFLGIHDFALQLKNLIDSDAEESQAEVAAETDGIQLMTVHKAKGLEFSAVFIAECNSTPKFNTARKDNIYLGKDFGILSKVQPSFSIMEAPISPLIHRLRDYEEKIKQTEENKRLFYVAVTRAKQFLFFIASLKEKSDLKDTSLKPNSGSFLDFLTTAIPSLNFSTPSSQIKLQGSVLVSRVKNETEYETVQNDITLSIPVINEVDAAELILDEPLKTPEEPERCIYPGALKDEADEEILTASKFLTYLFCPRRYYLQYELGYEGILDEITRIKPEIENAADGVNWFTSEEAKLRGTIVHALLARGLQEKATKETILSILRKECLSSNVREDRIAAIAADIHLLIEGYRKSITCTGLEKLGEGQAEYEIYSYEGFIEQNAGHYILQGIIDRLIYNGTTCRIVDYKTDKVNAETIESKKRDYLKQLSFYAYIAARKHPEIERFELQLVFLRLPDSENIVYKSREEVLMFKNQIDSVVKNIRKNIYFASLERCTLCPFVNDKNICILQD